jgi:phosphate-selective porin OprO/OprP
MHQKPVSCRSAVFFSFLILISGFFFHQPCQASEGSNAPPASTNVFILQSASDNTIAFALGGVFQTDYRYYNESERADNRFDIRRAQIELTCHFNDWLKLNMEYELKNDVSDRLMDTYAEISFDGQALRIGHFKKPFSLEFQTSDAEVYFAERSMGNFLSPGRDVGVMISGSFLNHHIYYATGLFNADGEDTSGSGNDQDEPEVIGRLVCSPFAGGETDWLRNFQFGGSATFARMNLSDLSLKVKSTGMVDTSRNIYELKHDTKFGVIQDVDDRWRIGLEAAWAWESLACQAEYISLTYTSLKPAGSRTRDADFSSWYVSMLYFVTGEQPTFSKGVMDPFPPRNPFNLSAGNYGAFGIAARYDHFNGDRDWINPVSHVSVDKAEAYSLAVNWILLPMHRIILDYTYTDLSDKIRVKVNTDGSIDYIDKENAVTLRYSISF